MRKRGNKSTKTLWIFCEGKTEKLYFDKLKFDRRISRLKIKSKESGYKNADGIIKESFDFMKKSRDFQKDDLVVCVFDRDANTNEQLEKAKSLAEKNNILISFSNPCFEYWILCHYNYFSSSEEKDTLVGKLSKLAKDYKNHDPDLYSKTKDKISIAMSNAKRVREKHVNDNNNLISRQSNPLSLVFELIQIIKEFED